MLVKSTPGLNFINILRTAFTLVDPQSIKIQLSHQCLFMLLGFTSVKAVRRTLMKLSPAHIKASSKMMEENCGSADNLAFFNFDSKEKQKQF